MQLQQLNLLVLMVSLSLIVVSGQRSRSNTENNDEATPVRTRGRTRFTATDEFAQLQGQPQETTSMKRTSTRTRIQANSNARVKPTEIPSRRTYAVEEVNDDSPIDSFRRQSRPRVLTVSRFDPPIQSSTPILPLINSLPVEELGFGSTARAILQARGQTVPPKTTTPIVDEAYLLNNFGNMFRSLAGNQNIDFPSEAPSFHREESASRRTSPLRNTETERSRTLESIVNTDSVSRSNFRTRSRTRPKEITTPKTEQPQIIETEAVPEQVEALPEQPQEVLTELAIDASAPIDSQPLVEEIVTEKTTTTTTTAQPVRRVVVGRRRGPAKPSSDSDIVVTPRSKSSRVRTTRLPETTSTSGSTFRRAGRRKVEEPAETLQLAEERQPTRPRNGRRIKSKTKIVEDATKSTTVRSRTSSTIRRLDEYRRSNPDDVSTEAPFKKRSRFDKTTNDGKTTEKTRSRYLEIPLEIDDSKLEVLPLFERESSTSITPVRRGKRIRSNFNSRQNTDYMHVSATENDVKSIEKMPSDAVFKVKSVEASTSRSRFSVKSFTTEPTTVKSITRSPPIIKESVISEVNQVISKSTITRRKKVLKSNSTQANRGTKKSDVKLDLPKKKNSEEVSEDDNYPAAFKALLQTKKNKDETRPTKLPSGSPSTTLNVKNQSADGVFVTSTALPRSSSVTRAIILSTTKIPKRSNRPNEIINDNDNELDANKVSTTTTARARQLNVLPTEEVTRKSYTSRSTTEYPKRNSLRSTASTTPLSVKESKYSSRFHKKTGATSKEIVDKNDFELIQQKKITPSRYSSRYRSDTSNTRSSTLKITTSAPFYTPTIPTPAYIPTVPTIVPSLPQLDDGGVIAVKDPDLGMEVLTFDQPVNRIPSADLVNGEFLTTDRNFKLHMVKNATAEKPVSIIERIINSITMISTTAAPNLTTLNPSVSAEDQQSSAILKLATKKTISTDKTKPNIQTTNIIETITSEKPTTIIEKIRSSLSAIQTNEVGTNDYDIVAISSTTPLSAVTKYSAKYKLGSSVALPAPQPLSTTTINSYNDDDEYRVRQQKSRISKLLDILNGLVSTELPDDKLVVVTPKLGGFVSTLSPQEPLEIVNLFGTTPGFPVNTDTSTDSSTLYTTQASSTQSTDTSGTTTTESTSTASTLYPTISTFHVSPDSVSVYSANDLSNFLTHDVDNLYNTVTIASRGFDSVLTENPTTTTESVDTTTTEVDTSTIVDSTTVDITTSTENSTTVDGTTTVDSTTLLETTTKSDTESTTIILTSTVPNLSSRSGKLLEDFDEPIGNRIDTPTTPSTTPTSSTPDYYVFAVLNNNTILRKPPPSVPNKDTPYIIVGLYPNNTVVRKYPNGTLVPMDPIIKVRGFDIRPNPPPVIDITSNQVTDTTNGLTTADNTVESNRMSRLLQTAVLSTTTGAPTIPSPIVVRISTNTKPTSTTQKTKIVTTEIVPATLSEILNGKTVDALNNLIKTEPATSTESIDFKTLQVNQYNQVLNIQDLLSKEKESSVYRWKSNTDRPSIEKSAEVSTTSSEAPITISTTLVPTTLQPSTTTTTEAPTTTTTVTTTTTEATTTNPPTTTVPSTTTRKITTTKPRLSTTAYPAYTQPSAFPTFLTTLFPGLLSTVTTPRSFESSSRRSYDNELRNTIEYLSGAGTTVQPIRERVPTTLPTTTTILPTTTVKPKAVSKKEETDKLFDELKKSGKLNNLNEEQRRNLMEIEKIEKEQKELLKQLQLLTTMFGGQTGRAAQLPAQANPLGTSSSNLANRIIAMAQERDKSKTRVPKPTTTELPTTKRPNSIQDQLPITTNSEDTTRKTTPSLEDVLKQYNINGLSTSAPLTSTYGKSDEAVLAAILKEHGIGPSTPKGLKEAGIVEEATTKKPRARSRPATTTTIRPLGGRLMQGLNWLIDILDPPTTKRPVARKAKAKPPAPKPQPDDELLTNQPTRITPMVTAAPATKPSLSQEEIQSLIKQLEAVQDDPNAADQLDFSKIISLHNLINVNEGVEVTHAGQHGATSYITPRPRKPATTTEREKLVDAANRRRKPSTVSTLSVSNSLDEDAELESTTGRTRMMPPVSLNPIPGIDDQGDSVVRSNLLTAAVNVTRAISTFLGSAFQGATRGFRSLITSGSSMVGNISQQNSRSR